MNRITLIAAFLFLIGTISAAAQILNRDLNQIRAETAERNRAIENHDRINQNNTVITRNRAILRNRKIPDSAVRSYVLAAQAQTEVEVLSIVSGDILLVSDGVNKTVVRLIGIDAPEDGQKFYEEAKKNLTETLNCKKIILKYSLHYLKDDDGYFPGRIFIGEQDAGLLALEKGLAWRNPNDKLFLDKKEDAVYEQAEARARAAQIGIWLEEKPQKPWKYRERKIEEAQRSIRKKDEN